MRFIVTAVTQVQDITVLIVWDVLVCDVVHMDRWLFTALQLADVP